MFTPIIPAGGLVGWRFLQNTQEAQFDSFTKSPQVRRDADHFRDRIGEISNAADLVQDRQLLSVALGAFGLQDDIDNRAFIRQVLEEGTVDDEALANRFADSRYAELSAAFGFGPQEASPVKDAAFVEDMISRFEAGRFEEAAGAQEASMRVALYADRTLPRLAEEDLSIDSKWFTIMGDPPLRQLFERALNLPKEMGQIDIDQQLGIFRDRARRVFGSDDPAQFAQSEAREDLITKYMVREQLAGIGGAMSGGAIALTLLGG